MGIFTYKILTKDQKIKKGSIEADFAKNAKNLLEQQGNTVISLKEAGVLNKEISFDWLLKKVTSRDLSVFCRQITSILEAGVGIVNALEMLSKQTENKRLQIALKEIQLAVERGSSLAEAMGEYETIFPKLFIHMIEAGETTGSLEISFSRMGDYFDKESHLKNMVKKAMVYPSAVGIVAVAVIFLMMHFVVPNFIVMFSDMNIEMPAVTLFVIGMSNFIVEKGYLFFLLIGALIVAYKVFAATQVGRYFLANLQLRLPLFGTLVTKTASSQFVRTLGTLLAAGVSMVQALEITSNIMGNIRFKDALMEAREEVMQGVNLSEPVKECQLFPPMVYYMIGIGEEAGKIEEMLHNVAVYYDEEVELATQQLMTALEPMIIVLLALIVGGILGAIMLPMMSLYNAVGTM